MTPAIFILCLNWTFSGLCSEDYLNLGGFVGQVVNLNGDLIYFMPAICFLLSLGMSFTTGNSWGTFGIIIPIAITIMGTSDMSLVAITVAAILSGAVSGDHASPIADTTILSSAGAQCDHIEHVNTQLPYVVLVSACSFVGYLAGGLANNGWIGMGAGFACLLATMVAIYLRVPATDA